MKTTRRKGFVAAWLCCSDGISFAPVNRALWNLVTAKTRRDVLSVCVCVCVCARISHRKLVGGSIRLISRADCDDLMLS